MNRATQLKKFDPIARLRRIRGVAEPELSALSGAVTRIENSPDGRIFFEWLYWQTHGKVLPHDAPESALREVMANRSLFDRILKLVEDTNDNRRSGSNA